MKLNKWKIGHLFFKYDDWGRKLRSWVGISTFIVIALIVVSGFVGGALFLDQRSCSSEAHGLELEHRWGPLMGCLLKTQDGRYIPDTQYFINHPQP